MTTETTTAQTTSTGRPELRQTGLVHQSLTMVRRNLRHIKRQPEALTDVTIPARRVQAAILATGPIRRGFGWRELKLQSLAQDDRGKGDHVIAPLATETELRALVAEVGWPVAPDASAWRRISLRRGERSRSPSAGRSCPPTRRRSHSVRRAALNHGFTRDPE